MSIPAAPLPNPIAGYEDWPAFARKATPYIPTTERSRVLATALKIPAIPSVEVRTEREWVHDGVAGTELSWSVGFGPRTTAWLLRPEGSNAELPGVLALHFHGNVKWVGAEQLVDLGARASVEALELRTEYYDDLSPASELAKRGYAVLVHDAFMWDSRRFPLAELGQKTALGMAGLEAQWRESATTPTEAERYNAAAYLHEDTVAKAAGVLGTTLTGTVVFDDLVALDVLSRLPGVDATKLGCFGLSGGGTRSALLAALEPRIVARVITCMMVTFESMIPLYLDRHSWLINSPGLWSAGEWPEHAAAEATRALLVQYGTTDDLFSLEGMQAADVQLRELFHTSGAYRGTFYDCAHAFGAAMQAEAWDFFDRELRGC
jgi:dienelactone hydrolase